LYGDGQKTRGVLVVLIKSESAHTWPDYQKL